MELREEKFALDSWWTRFNSFMDTSPLMHFLADAGRAAWKGEARKIGHVAADMIKGKKKESETVLYIGLRLF